MALVLLHVVLTIKMQYPNIWDEFGYLGRARYLAGAAHLPHNIGPYHFGYSLFLVPSFWLFSDPYYIYKAVLITNSLMISTLYFPLYYIMHSLLDNEKRLSALIAFVCCLYPAFLLQSNLAWSESAFIPIYASFIASFGTFIKRKSYSTLFLFSSFCGFLYTIHPRALPILPIAICYMCFLAALKEIRKYQLLQFILIAAFIFLLTNLIDSHFLSVPGIETTNDIVTNRLHRLFSLSNLPLILMKTLGQLLYLLVATYGLIFVGLVFACGSVLKKWKENHLTAFSNIQFNTFLLLILSSLGMFVASALQMLYGERGDHLFYGRYNESFLGLYLMLGVRTIYYAKYFSWAKRIINPYIISIVIVTLMVILVGSYGFEALFNICKVTNVNVLNVLGIYPLIGMLRRLDIILISLISIPLIFSLMYTFKYSFKCGLSLLALYFCVVFISAYTVFYVRASYIKQVTTLTSHIDSIENVGRVSYDKAFQHVDTWPAYQYLLPRVKFDTFNSKNNELPGSRIVISGKHWKDRKNLGADLIACENVAPQLPVIIVQIIVMFLEEALPANYTIDQCLWILPECQT